jgi:hypothetical protein
MKILLLTLLLVSGLAQSHEQVPTYPKWKNGIYTGILTTRIEIFNKRSDIEYYEIGVFDANWQPVFFVADYKIIQLKYLSSASIDVYIAKENRDRVEYICSRSKVKKGNTSVPAVSSRICSRFRE